MMPFFSTCAASIFHAKAVSALPYFAILPPLPLSFFFIFAEAH